MEHEQIGIPLAQLGRPRRVIVVGAGVAGLTAAYYLSKLGLDVHVFDAASRAGGLIHTSLERERYLVEHGAYAYPAQQEHLDGLARELSINTLERTAAVRKQFIYSDGELHPVPTTALGLIGSRLITGVGKLRALAELFIRTHSEEGETIAQFVRRRAGSEMLDNLVTPFVSSRWAGDPEALEVKSSFAKLFELEEKYGSIARAAFKEKGVLAPPDIVSYRWGMSTLSARLEETLGDALHFKTPVEHVGLNERGRPVVAFRGHDEKMVADAVVVATNTSAAPPLISTIAPRAAQLIASITSCPLAVVHTAFDRRDVSTKPKGRGYIVPRTENVRSLGTLFSSTLFENRAPEDETLFTSYVGGATDPEACVLDDEELVNTVRKDLHMTMGIGAKPTFVCIKRIREALPQYAVGHTRRIFEVDQCIDTVPGLFLTGNYFNGTQIPAIIDHARRTALKVRAWLRRAVKSEE